MTRWSRARCRVDVSDGAAGAVVVRSWTPARRRESEPPRRDRAPATTLAAVDPRVSQGDDRPCGTLDEGEESVTGLPDRTSRRSAKSAPIAISARSAQNATICEAVEARKAGRSQPSQTLAARTGLGPAVELVRERSRISARAAADGYQLIEAREPKASSSVEHLVRVLLSWARRIVCRDEQIFGLDARSASCRPPS